MAPLMIAAIGAQALSGLAQVGTGIGQEAKAKKIARNNIRPDYTTPKAITDNQQIAEAAASRGLSGQSVDLYKQASDRQQSSAIDAILKGGGSVNNIGALYGATNDGLTRMALIDDEMRSRNIKSLVAQNNVLADYKDKEWQINSWGPYADKAQAAAALKKQGSENLWKGIGTVTSAISNAATASQYGKEGADVFKSSVGSAGAAAAAAGTAGGVAESVPYVSRMVSTTLTPQQRVTSRYPGLTGNNLATEMVWDNQLGAYVDPTTGQTSY